MVAKTLNNRLVNVLGHETKGSDDKVTCQTSNV